MRPRGGAASASCGLTRCSCARASRGARPRSPPGPGSYGSERLRWGACSLPSRRRSARPATRCTRSPSTCSPRRAIASTATSVCARRPAGFGTPDLRRRRDRARRRQRARARTRRRGTARTDSRRCGAAAEFVGVPLGRARDVYTPATALEPDARARRRCARLHTRSPSGTRSRDERLAEVCGRHPDDRVRARGSSGPSTSTSRSISVTRRAGTRANYGASPGDDTIRRAVPVRRARGTRARKTGPFGRVPVRRRAARTRSSSPRRARARGAGDFFDVGAGASRLGADARVTSRHGADVHPHGPVDRRAVGGHRARRRASTRSRVADRALEHAALARRDHRRLRRRPAHALAADRDAAPSAAAPTPRWCSRRCSTTSARP